MPFGSKDFGSKCESEGKSLKNLKEENVLPLDKNLRCHSTLASGVESGLCPGKSEIWATSWKDYAVMWVKEDVGRHQFWRGRWGKENCIERGGDRKEIE